MIVMASIISKDKVYKRRIEGLKKRIKTAQIKAAPKVNSKLLDLYWHLGQGIVTKQKESNSVNSVINQLSKDPTAAFPA